MQYTLLATGLYRCPNTRAWYEPARIFRDTKIETCECALCDEQGRNRKIAGYNPGRPNYHQYPRFTPGGYREYICKPSIKSLIKQAWGRLWRRRPN